MTIITIPLPSDVRLACIVRLATALYFRAHSDLKSNSKSARKHRKSAQSFLANAPLAESIAEVLDCENAGAVEADYEIERKYFVEINDEGGRRGLTNDQAIVIRGYIQPLKRNRRGVASVIIVEEPVEFAMRWRALPTDEWIALDDYTGPAGTITERAYARFLAKVPGLQASHVSIGRRRALSEDEIAHRQK